MENLNWLDLLVIGILGLFAFKGLLNGFIAEVTGIISIVVGLFLASRFSDNLAEIVYPYAKNFGLNAVGTKIAAIILILVLFMLLMTLLARMLNKFLALTFTKWIDYLLGAGAGLAKGYILVAIMAYALKYFLPSVEIVKNSFTLDYLIKLGNYIMQNFIGA